MPLITARLGTGYATYTMSPIHTTPMLHGDDSLQLAWLRHFLAWIVPCNLAFAIVEAIAFVVFRDMQTGISAALLLAGSVILMLARKLVQRGRMQNAVSAICATLLGLGVLMVLLQPGLRATLACIPLLSVALALPYLSGRPLRLLMAAALVTTIIVVAAGEFVRPSSQLPAWFALTFRTTSLAATIALIMLLLWQFSSRLTATLHRTQAAEERFRQVTEHVREVFWMRDVATGQPHLRQPRLPGNLGAQVLRTLRRARRMAGRDSPR